MVLLLGSLLASCSNDQVGKVVSNIIPVLFCLCVILFLHYSCLVLCLRVLNKENLLIKLVVFADNQNMGCVNKGVQV